MKLHLPAFLRKAVLACLAALAMPLTLGSGAAFLSSGALVSFALSQSVMAETFNHDDGVTYSGDIFSLDASGNINLTWTNAPWVFRYYWDEEQQSMVSDSTQVSFGATFAPNSGQQWDNIPGHTLRLYGATGDKQIGVQASNGNFWLGGLIVEDSGVAEGITYWFSRTNMDPGMTYSFGAQEGQAVNMTLRESVEFGAKNYNVYSDGTWTIRGDRTLTFGTRNSNAGSRQFIVYAGKALTFDKLPDSAPESGDANVVFSGHEVVLQSGSSIAVSQGVSVTMGNGVSAADGSVTVNGFLQLGATSTIGTLSCDNWGTQGSILFGSSTGKLTIGAGSLTTLRMLEGSTLKVTSGQLSIAHIDVQNPDTHATGGEANLEVNIAGEAKLRIFEIMGQGRLRLSITNADAVAIVANGGEYQLFDADFWREYPIVDNIIFDDLLIGRTTVRLDASTGKLIAEGAPENLLWQGSALTWANGGDAQWNTSATDKHFYDGDNVSFTGAGTVTVEGTVTPGSMTVSGDYTFSGGVLTMSSAIQVTSGTTTFSDTNITSNGLNIAAGATVVLSAVTNKTLGGITVEDGGTLRLTARGTENEWHGGSVTGDGVLELATGQRWMVTGSAGGMMMWSVLSQTAGETIGELKVVRGTILDARDGAKDAYRTAWQNVKKITIESGSHWGISSSNFTNHASWSLDHEYHIAGTGTGNTVSGATTVENSSALSFDDKFGNDAHNYFLSGDLYLDDVAAVLVGNNDGNGTDSVATVRGTFHAGTHGLTKLGNGTLVLTNVDGGANAGDVTISEGTLRMALSAVDDEEASKKVAKAVDVAAGATLDLVGSYGYEMDKVTGAGNLTSSEAAKGTLIINPGKNVEAVFSGAVSGLAGVVKKGTGKQSFTNAAAFDGAVEVQGGELLLTGTSTLTSVKVKGGAILDLQNAAESGLTVNGEVSLGGTLKLAHGTLSAASLVVTQAKGAIIDMQLVSGRTLLDVEEVSNAGSLKLVVHGALGEYQLFNRDHLPNGFTSDNVDITQVNDTGRGVSAAYNQNTGVLTIGGNNFDLRWTGGDMQWGAGMADVQWDNVSEDHDGESAYFVDGDSVIFDGTAHEGNVSVTVIINGARANAMTVLTDADTDYSCNGATIHLTGKLTVTGGGKVDFAGSVSVYVDGGAEVTGGSTLELSGMRAGKTLNNIAVEAGSVVVVSALEGFGSTTQNYVSGDGSLVFKGIETPVNGWNTAWGENMITSFLSGTANTLNELVFRDSDFVFSTDRSAKLNTARNIVVESGSSVGIGNSDALGTRGHTLHLNGAGLSNKGALYADDSVGMAWDIVLESAASIGTQGNNNGEHEYTLTLNGALFVNNQMLTKVGAGSLILTNIQGGDYAGNMVVEKGTLQLEFAAQYDELVAPKMEVKEGATLSLVGGKTYSIAYLAGAGEVSSTDASSLIIDGDSAKVVEFSGSMSGLAKLTKTGEGRQSLAAIGAAELEVTGGELIYAGKGAAESFAPTAASVSSATLTLAASGSLAAGGTSLMLEKGAELRMASTADNVSVKLGSLTVSGANSISWADAARAQSLSFTSLSGTGNLNVGTLSSEAAQQLSIGKLRDFSGTLSGAVGGKSVVRVGSISAAADGSINVAGGVHVNDVLAKSGDGKFSINHLIVDKDNTLNMNYEGGALSITTLHVASGGVLSYASGSRENVVHAQISDLLHDGFAGEIRLDVWAVDADTLEKGVCLGIEKGSMDVAAAELAKYFSIDFSDWGGEFALSWGEDDMLYLNVTKVRTNVSEWDPNWGVSVVKLAPSAAALAEKAKVYVAEDLGALSPQTTPPDFTHVSLALADKEDRYAGEGSYYVALTDGPTSPTTLASVMGGKLYGENAVADRHAGNSYIYLTPEEGKSVYFHLLVGGSSCVATSAGDGAGFVGDSHIQVKGGSVDYIIGGNHVTNAPFTFEGDSYISVYEGSIVRGGIVGGSTLTSGAEAAYEFNGSSHIHVYTVLTNGNKLPSISDATHSGESSGSGKAFAAVVGGNAWVDLPTAGTGDANPTFHGTSMIVVDLSDYKGSADNNVFQKAIVGGNYTVEFTDAEKAAYSGRSTVFEGTAEGDDASAYVRVTAGDDIEFTGGISGASRRASGGNGHTEFSGNTRVTIAGGTHSEAIAGGFWFEESASGQHTSQLEGDTTVSIEKGQVWRAVGGSYSLGGDDQARDLHIGSSRVSISGSSVVNASFHAGDYGQKGISFVAGGNFYRNSQGEYRRVDGDTLVEISGNAVLGLESDGVHVVGGDYVNSTGAATAGADIDGNTGVRMSGGSVLGLVVGGSYLTDEGQGGRVSISGASSVTLSGGVVEADSPLTNTSHVHNEVAIVGGSAIVDDGVVSGGHVAEVGSSAVSISGGVVNGNIVGGSFSNNADGVNTLSLGSASVTISGGEVYGNIYGGHFSTNTFTPDKLTLGSATVKLQEGALVKGNVVGGSFRLAINPAASAADAPQQGSILVQLEGGTLDGHVYAAGWNDSLLSNALSVQTESTRVEISNRVRFEHIEGPGYSAVGDVIVSGGYMKATGAADLSTVTGESELVFTTSGAYDNISRLSFVDFNAVSVADGAEILLEDGRFYARDNVSFTKKGAGVLALTTLQFRNANGAAQRFNGKIAVAGGSLLLHSDQSVDKGLSFDLSLGINTRETAYLQAVDGAHLMVAGLHSVDVEISAVLGGDTLRAGTYYLASGFEDEDALEAFRLIDPEIDGYNMYLDMIDGDCLALHVRRYNPEQWIWDGTDAADGNVWDGTSADNWTYEGDVPDAPDVHFAAGAMRQDVSIRGTVRPSNVYVEGGDYIFTQETGSKGGLDIIDTLHVGNANTGEAASLRMELANTAVPNVALHENGVLMLAHKGALNKVESISFLGGVLGYAVDAEGNLLNADDLSAAVAAGEGALKLRVGDPGAQAAAATVTWGSAKATTETEGIRRILADGLELSGSAGFTVEWAAAPGETVTGDTTVSGGHARYLAHVQKGRTVTLQNNIHVEKDAAVTLSAAGGTLAVHSELSGDGAVAIGGGDAAYELSGDNSGFAGTIELVGKSPAESILVKDANALGGKDTKLMLSGRSLKLSDETTASVAAGQVLVLGENYLGGAAPEGVNTGITLQGDVLAASSADTAAAQSVLVAAGAARHTIQGSVAGYSGTLKAQAAESAWTLGNEQSATLENATTIAANLSGQGQVTVAYRVDAEDGTVLLSGAITDSLDVENATNATIIIAGNAENSSSGKLIATGALPQQAEDEVAPAAARAAAPASVGGNFRLGTAEQSGVWAGTELQGSADKSLTLVNGSLTHGIATKGGMQLNVDTTPADGLRVLGGGTKGALFDAITLGANTRLSGVSGDVVVSSSATDMSGSAEHAGLEFGATNIGAAAGEDEAYLLGLDGGNLIVAENAAMSMDFSNDGFVELLKKHRAEGAKSYAHAVSGGGIVFRDASAETALQMLFRDGGYAALLGGLSFHYVGVSAGDIMITGSSSEVYLVLHEGDDKGDPHTVTNYGLLDTYLATVLDKGETLSICVGDDLRPNADGTAKTVNNLTVNNLVGLEGTTLKLSRSGNATKDVTVSLSNASVKVSDEFGLPEGVTPESLSCIDTEFEGSIMSTDAHVHLNKIGPGTLTVGSKSGDVGGLSLAGDLRLSGGSIVSRAKESTLNNIVFAYDSAANAALEEARGYVVRGGLTTVSGSIREQGSYTEDNLILLEQGGELLLTGSSAVESVSILAEPGGLLNINGESASLSIGGDSVIDGADVQLRDGAALALSAASKMSVQSLSLDAASSLTVGGVETHSAVTLSGDGTLKGDGGQLALTGAGSSFTGRFEGAATLSVSKGASLSLKDAYMDATAGKWSLSNSGSLTIDVAKSNQDVMIDSLTLAAGSQTTYVYDTDRVGSKNLLSINSLHADKTAQVTIRSTGREAVHDMHLRLGSVAETSGTLTNVTLEGLPFLHYTGSLQWKKGELYLNLRLKDGNPLLLPNMEKNARAGAQLFYAATGPEGNWLNGSMNDENSQLSKMAAAIEQMSSAGETAMLSRTLAAGAGASIATLGSALSQDLQRQLSAMRTRTASMGSDVTTAPGTRSYSMWINGEGSYHKLKADGLAPGFTLQGWGGTVGMHAELAPGATVGMAISAMYNDLKTDSADNGRGDLDTTYLSIFGRKTVGAWMHSIVLSGGMADVTLNRTVNHVTGSYSTKGSTDGYAVGLLYELGYSKVLRADGSFILQPVFNVELRHAGVKGYAETGSDAGLRVDDISQNVLTFGLGARMQRIVGENAFNRAAVLEGRFLLKADAGDNSSKADNALINGAARSAEVESAEVGPVGIEIGAGLTIPVGVKSGTLFVDASVELRDGYTGMDANVGYRINF